MQFTTKIDEVTAEINRVEQQLHSFELEGSDRTSSSEDQDQTPPQEMVDSGESQESRHFEDLKIHGGNHYLNKRLVALQCQLSLLEKRRNEETCREETLCHQHETDERNALSNLTTCREKLAAYLTAIQQVEFLRVDSSIEAGGCTFCKY